MHHICSGETQKTDEYQYSYDDGYNEGYYGACKTFARELPEKSFRRRELYNYRACAAHREARSIQARALLQTLYGKSINEDEEALVLSRPFSDCHCDHTEHPALGVPSLNA